MAIVDTRKKRLAKPSQNQLQQEELLRKLFPFLSAPPALHLQQEARTNTLIAEEPTQFAWLLHASKNHSQVARIVLIATHGTIQESKFVRCKKHTSHDLNSRYTEITHALLRSRALPPKKEACKDCFQRAENSLCRVKNCNTKRARFRLHCAACYNFI